MKKVDYRKGITDYRESDLISIQALLRKRMMFCT